MPFFHRMGASRLDRTICTPAQDAGWEAVMGRTPGPSPEVARESDLVVLWGINAVATNLHFVQRAKEARRRGRADPAHRHLRQRHRRRGRRGDPGPAGLGRRAGAGHRARAGPGGAGRRGVPGARDGGLAGAPRPGPGRVRAGGGERAGRALARGHRGAGPDAGPRPGALHPRRRRSLALRQRRHDRPLHRGPGGGPGRLRPARAAAACSRPALVARPSTCRPCWREDLLPRPDPARAT